MKPREVLPGVWMLKQPGLSSNVYVVDGVLVIDTGAPKNREALRRDLEVIGIDPLEVRTVVNTHCHADHIGNNALFERAKILAHENDADAIENADPMYTYSFMFPGEIEPVKIATRLADGDVIRTPKRKLVVVHTPGHTPGSICLFDPVNKILFSGDTILEKTTGRVDLLGGSEEDMRESVKKIDKLDPVLVLGGHGKPMHWNTIKNSILERVH